MTLLELVVALAIIGMLLSVAAPAYGGARRQTADRAAQANLRTVLQSARAVAVDSGDYSRLSAPGLSVDALRLDVVGSGEVSTRASRVSVGVVDGWTLYAVSRSRNGICFAFRDEMAGGLGGTSFTEFGGPCTADEAILLDAGMWRSRW